MKHKFTITTRVGRSRKNKKALWINDQNIWDLDPKEVTPDVLNAIISAYFIGRRFMQREIQEIGCGSSFGYKFKEE